MKHNKELLSQIGNKIRTLRELRKLTQENVSNELDITQKTYSNIENGITDMTISILYKISGVLGFSVNDILELDENSFIQNIFNNNNGNKGVNIMNQHSNNVNDIKSLYERLLQEQKEKYEQIIENIKKQ
ncbi:MAG TPA: helix-turn-helix transcriptional regulator [Chitinophagales bacterium]|jgi:transcriptional regulator with XRE-family HTH domain|nr:helix-turn-helix transcriptional regulator [Chitinophagales bacterium]